MPLRRWIIPFVLLATCVGAVSAHASGVVQSQARTILKSRDLGKTTISAFATDLTDDRVLIRINADEPMIPASNMKLLTTAVALGVLKPSFVFHTDLRIIGGNGQTPQSGGVLLLAGDGDPALGDPELLKTTHQMHLDQMLQHWVDAVIRAGIRHVARLAVDDRVFDRQWIHPDWPEDQLNRWYCAEVAGLNLHENCVHLYAQPTALGQTARVTMRPKLSAITALSRNRAITAKTDTFWVSRKFNTNKMTYRGNVRNRRRPPVKTTIHDPPLFAAELLAERLRDAGVAVDTVGHVEHDEHLPEGRTLLRWMTPLADVLTRCNKDSQNLFAEALLKRVGRHMTGAPGSWDNGTAAMRKWLTVRLGSGASLIQISDGSGMSRNNRVSSRLLVQLLRTMVLDPELSATYVNSLAIGGLDGTLKKRFRPSPMGTVHGKSGYINGVCSLSGYLVYGDANDTIVAADREDAGRRRVIAFSFLFNNIKPPVYVRKVRSVHEELVRMIDSHVAPAREPARLGG